MSLAVVIEALRTCSGLAYSGVIIGRAVAGDSPGPSLSPDWAILAIPKSSSFGSPWRRDENIPRLEVTMQDQVLVRVLYCEAHGPEKFQAFAGRPIDSSGSTDQSASRSRIPSPRNEGHPQWFLHQEAGDVGMIESCQNLALSLEARNEIAGAETALDDFDRNLLFVCAVVANRPIDFAHSAAAEFRDQAEWEIVRPINGCSSISNENSSSERVSA